MLAHVSAGVTAADGLAVEGAVKLSIEQMQ
jgi:hypothetical protein